MSCIIDINHVSDVLSDILSENTICFDIRNINIEQIPIPISDAKFGILNFKAINVGETSHELDFLIKVDCSGSMSDFCADGRSKMQHIVHTLKNMVLFFHEHPNVKINITINAFDTQIYPILSRTNITDENISQIISKIEKINPRGSTDIEFALKKSAEEINKIISEFPNNNVVHIFMTDGEATDGSRDINILKKNINPNITNAFIGFGVDHDAVLLNGISSFDNSSYYFIDKLESSGLVYGEILHGIIYKVLTNSEIIIENGLIYNFKTNTWNESLKIGDIVSEANKTYNIISSNPELCKVNIKGTCTATDSVITLTSINIGNIGNADLSIQIYRQHTLQILYEVNDFCRRKRLYEDELDQSALGNIIPNQRDIFEEENKTLRFRLSSLMQDIKKYILDNKLEDNKILKNLCDDIYICFRTFGTKFGTMYCLSRQTSQGNQRQYTVSSTVEINNHLNENNMGNNLTRTPIFRRQNNVIRDNFNRFNMDYHEQPFGYNQEEDPDSFILQHSVSDFENTPYLTPQATQIMREISRNINYDEHDFCDISSVLTQNIY